MRRFLFAILPVLVGAIAAWADEPSSGSKVPTSRPGRLIGELPSGHVPNLSISRDGTLVAAAGFVQEIDVWEIETGTLRSKISRAAAYPWVLAFVEKALVIPSLDPPRAANRTALTIVAVNNWSVSRTVDGPNEQSSSIPEAMAASTDGGSLAVAHGAGRPFTVAIYDTVTWEIAHRIAPEDVTAYSIAIFPDARSLAISGMYLGNPGKGSRGAFEIWDIPKRERKDLIVLDAGAIRTSSASADGRWLAVGVQTGGWTNADELRRVEEGRRRGTTHAYLWDLASKKIGQSFGWAGGDVTSLSFSDNGALLAIGSDDGFARIFDTVTGRLVEQIQGEKGVVAVVFGAPGMLVFGNGKRISLVAVARR
jgi:WD40 repeat protein